MTMLIVGVGGARKESTIKHSMLRSNSIGDVKHLISSNDEGG